MSRLYAAGLWGQVHVRRVDGSSDVPVLLFHESPLSSRVWHGVFEAADGMDTLVAFDTPGYGLSDPPPSAGFEIPDYADALLSVIDDLGIDRFVAGGVHTGAAVALEVCQQAGPDRGIGLVMSGVPIFSDSARAEFLTSWCPPVPITADGERYRWALERYAGIYGPDTPTEMTHLAISELLFVAERYPWAYNAAFRYDPTPALAEVQTATLLLNAEHDMFADQDEVAAALLQRGAARVVVPGIVGQPHLRRPVEFASALSTFCRQVTPAE